jgi:YHS domain-containing protein
MNLALKRSIFLVFFSLISVFSYATDKPFNDKKGAAISGYDAVAYFTQGKAVKGSKKFSAQYLGKKWRFSSQEHKVLFEASPDKYAPQYGGYCAFAIANDKLAPIDPQAFTVVNNKLYLNYSKSVRKRWAKDIPGYIADGDENWAKL